MDNLVIENIWFKRYENRMNTWKKPEDTGQYQLDFIMVRHRFRYQVLKAVKCCRGRCGSDHNLVLIQCPQ